MSDRVEAGVLEAASQQEGGLLWKVAKYTGLTAIAGAWGAVMGASIGAQLPSTVELSEDVTVTASLDLGGEGIRAGEGPFGIQDLTQTIDIGPVAAGVQAPIKRFDLELEPESIAQAASIVANPQTNIIEPIQDAIFESAKLWAAGVGLAMASVTGAALITRLLLQRKDKKHAEELAKSQARAQSLQAENNEYRRKLGHEIIEPAEELSSTTSNRRVKRSRLARIGSLAAFASGAALFIGGPIAVQEINNAPPPATKTAQPLNKKLRERAGLSESTQVVGTGAVFFNVIATEAFKQLDIGDKSSRTAGRSLDTIFDTYVKENGLDYLANPDILPILLLSDIHCNAPFIEHILPRLVKYFGVRHILIAGDTLTTYGKLPIDNGCYDSLLDKLNDVATELDIEISVLESPGNHDTKNAMNIEHADQDGKIRVKFVRLTKENGYRSDDFGFSVVGSVNPTYSDFEGTTPEGIEAQHEALAEQGKRTADAACKAMNEDTYGRTPLVMTHDVAESIETMLRGCAFFVLNGHEHEDRGIQLYASPGGKLVTQYTMGTSSGADGGFTQITRIKKPAAATVLKLNTVTHTPEGFIKVILHHGRDAQVLARTPPSTPRAILNNPFFAEFTAKNILSRNNPVPTKPDHANREYPYKGNLRKAELQLNRASQATTRQRAVNLRQPR